MISFNFLWVVCCFLNYVVSFLIEVVVVIGKLWFLELHVLFRCTLWLCLFGWFEVDEGVILVIRVRGFLRLTLISFSKRRNCMTLLADLAMVLIRVKGGGLCGWKGWCSWVSVVDGL